METGAWSNHSAKSSSDYSGVKRANKFAKPHLFSS